MLDAQRRRRGVARACVPSRHFRCSGEGAVDGLVRGGGTSTNITDCTNPSSPQNPLIPYIEYTVPQSQGVRDSECIFLSGSHISKKIVRVSWNIKNVTNLQDIYINDSENYSFVQTNPIF